MSTIGGINVNSGSLLQSLWPLRSGSMYGVQQNFSSVPNFLNTPTRSITDSYTNTVLSSRSTLLRESVLAQRPLTVAKSDLTDIKTLLQEQQKLTQLLSGGALSNQQVAYLTQQFKDNLNKIDNIATQKNFKVNTDNNNNPNIKLLSTVSASTNSINVTAPTAGSVATSPAISVSGNIGEGQLLAEAPVAIVNGTASQQVTGQATIQFSNNNLAVGDSITLNGASIIAGSKGEGGFAVGETLDSTIKNILTTLNSSSDIRLQQATYSQSGTSSILVTLKGDGINNDFGVGFNIAHGTTKANITVLDASGKQTLGSSQLLASSEGTIAIIGTAGVDETAVPGTAGSVALRFTSNNITTNDKVTFGGVTLTANGTGANSFAVDETLDQTIDNIAAALNSSSNADKATFSRNGLDTIIATLQNIGTADNNFAVGFDIDSATTTAKISVLNAGGVETSMASNELTGASNTIASLGTAGANASNVLATKGTISLRLTNNTISAGDNFTFNGVKFTAGGSGATNFAIGSTLDVTINNLVSKLNASTNLSVKEATFARSGLDTIVATLKNTGASAADNDFGIGFNIAQNTKALISVENAVGTETVAAGNILSGTNTISSIGTAGIADTAATQGQVNLNFTGNLVAGQTFTFNGTTFTASNNTTGNNFKIASTVSGTINNLVSKLNSSTAAGVAEATYSRSGNTLIAKLDSAGVNNDFGIGFNLAGSTNTISVSNATGAETLAATKTLSGGRIETLGTAGLAATTGTKGVANLKFNSNQITNGVSLTLNGTKFTAGGTGSTGFAVGATLSQTLDNLVAKLNASTSSGVAKATYTRVGDDELKIQTKVNGANNNYTIAFNFQQATKAEVEVSNNTGITQAATGAASGTIASLGTAGTDAVIKPATQGVAQLKFDSNQITEGAAITLNGVTLTAGKTGANGFAIGASLSATLSNLATALNSNSNANLQKATYTAIGDTLKIQLKNAGTADNNYSIGYDFNLEAKAKVEVSDGRGNITKAASSVLSGGTVGTLGTAGTDVIATPGTKGTAQLKFDNNQIEAGAEITINGTTLVAGTTGSNGFAIGANISETLDNLINKLKSSTDTNIQKATYVQSGDNTLAITLKNAGTLDNNFTVGFNFTKESIKAKVSVLDGKGTATVNNSYNLTGGTLGTLGTAAVSSAAGDGTKGKVQLQLSDNNIASGATLTFNGKILIANGSDENSFKIGATLAETIDNIVTKLNTSSDAKVADATFSRTAEDKITVELNKIGTNNDFAFGFDLGKSAAKITVLNGSNTQTLAATSQLTSANIAQYGTAGKAETKFSDGATKFVPSLQGAISNLTAKFNEGERVTDSGSFNKNTVTFTAIIHGNSYTSRPVELQGGNFAGDGVGDNGFGNRISANTTLTFVRDGGALSEAAVTITTGNADILVNNSKDANSIASEFQALLTQNNISIQQDRVLGVNNPFNTVLGGIINKDVVLRSDNYNTNKISVNSFEFDTTNNSLITTIEGKKFTANLSSTAGFTGSFNAENKTLSTNGTIILSNASDNSQVRINLANVTRENISLALPENAGAFVDGLNALFGTEVKTTTIQVDPGTDGITANTVGSLVNNASTANLFVDDVGKQVNFSSPNDVVGSTEIIENALNKVSDLIANVDSAITSNNGLIATNMQTLMQVETKRAAILEEAVAVQERQKVQTLLQQNAQEALATQTNKLQDDLVQLIFKLNVKY